jgi:periplasmic protein CpxP/Spy
MPRVSETRDHPNHELEVPMTIPDTSTPSESGRSPSRPRRRILLALVTGIALIGGVAAVASGSSMCGWHHGGMLSSTASPAEVSAHVEHMLKHLYAEIDATDAQKAQIEPLVEQAVNDLLPLRTQWQTASARAIDGLTQASIDRTALETARETHMQLADQASKRFVQLIGDVGEVLTPEQRTALAKHLKKMHGMADS